MHMANTRGDQIHSVHYSCLQERNPSLNYKDSNQQINSMTNKLYIYLQSFFVFFQNANTDTEQRELPVIQV